MTAYITWRTGGSGELYLSTYSSITGDKPNLIPPQGVDVDGITIPYPLDLVFGSWEAIFNSPVSQLFYAEAGTVDLQLIPVTSYYFPVSAYNEEPSYAVVIDFQNGESRRIPVTEEILEFLPLAYPGLEVDPPLSWDDLKNRGRNIIVTDLLPYVTSSAITGDPVPAAVVAVQAICVDPESAYTTPLGALPDFQSGAEGIATTAGYVWPPV